jgi:hypothetical protein
MATEMMSPPVTAIVPLLLRIVLHLVIITSSS